MASSLTIDAVATVERQRSDENESPGSGKRKSGLISPSSRCPPGGGDAATFGGGESTLGGSGSHGGGRPPRRTPLSEVNSKASFRSSASSACSSSVGSKSTTTPFKLTPRRSNPSTPLPPYSSGCKFKQRASPSPALSHHHHHHLRRQSKGVGIEATDEKQASVGQLSSWLAESAKKNRRSKTNTVVVRPDLLPPPSGGSGSGSSSSIGGTPTPVRSAFRATPRIKKCEVMATDSKVASVKTLSSWMDGDPFEKKKKVRGSIRTGRRVISRSRIFEGPSPELRRECDIREGSVKKNSAWLSEAFKSEGEEASAMSSQQPSMEKRIRAYQIKKESSAPIKELRSVKDKKEWLAKAFKKGEEGQRAGTPDVLRDESFDSANNSNVRGAGDVLDIAKCASADNHDGGAPETTIQHTKSCDNGTPLLERQRSIVRLYADRSSGADDDVDDDDDQEEKAEEGGSAGESDVPKRTSVREQQAWLSGAFVKRRPTSAGATASTVEVEDGTGPGETTGDGSRKGTAVATVVEETSEKQRRPVSVAVEEAHGRGLDKQRRRLLVTGKMNAEETTTAAVEGKEVGSKESGGGGDSSSVDRDKMSVAERARWLKGAFR